MRNSENERLPWQHLITMVIDKICKVTVKGVKLKSESFFSVSYGDLELFFSTFFPGNIWVVREFSKATLNIQIFTSILLYGYFLE